LLAEVPLNGNRLEWLQNGGSQALTALALSGCSEETNTPFLGVPRLLVKGRKDRSRTEGCRRGKNMVPGG
jgi:hypothetical protein